MSAVDDALQSGGGGWNPPVTTAPFTVYDANGNALFNVDANGLLTIESASGAKIQLDPSSAIPVLHFFSIDGTNDAYINVVNTGNGNADLGINSGKYTPSDGVMRRTRLYMADSADASVFQCIDEATENTDGGKFQVASVAAWMGYQTPSGVDNYARVDKNGFAVNTAISLDGANWTAATLLNGWTDRGGNYALTHVRKVASPPNSLQLRANLNQGTAYADGTPIMLLPNGYWPKYGATWTGGKNGGAGASFDLSPVDGQVRIYGHTAGNVEQFQTIVPMD